MRKQDIKVDMEYVMFTASVSEFHVPGFGKPSTREYRIKRSHDHVSRVKVLSKSAPVMTNFKISQSGIKLCIISPNELMPRRVGPFREMRTAFKAGDEITLPGGAHLMMPWDEYEKAMAPKLAQWAEEDRRDEAITAECETLEAEAHALGLNSASWDQDYQQPEFTVSKDDFTALVKMYEFAAQNQDA